MPQPPLLAEVGVVVSRLLDGARRPAVVITDLDVPFDAPDTVVRRIGEALPEGQQRTLILVSADAESLRRDASRLGNLRWARMFGCVVVEAEAVPVLHPHPSWPALVDADARLEGAIASSRIDLAARTEAAPILMAYAASAAAPVRPGPGGLRVAGDVVPPVDPTYAARYDVDDERPADVVIGVATDALAPSPVLGRAPTRVSPVAAGVPLDEAVYNPIGFRRTWTRPMVDLPSGTVLTPGLISSLRDAQGVRLAPDADPRLAAGLAMCGIVTEQIDDPLERERHSVRTRRTALLEHSTTAWRARLAATAGVAHDPFPDEVTSTTEVPDEVTDLLLARRYSGADLVVLPDDADADDGETECFVAGSAVVPPGALLHARGRTPAEIVTSGGTVYVTHARSAL